MEETVVGYFVSFNHFFPVTEIKPFLVTELKLKYKYLIEISKMKNTK